MAKVTLQSVADEVGVSRMTVSNAFSRPDQLSADLRTRILEAAQKLGYVGPDPAGRALARGRVGSVGLLLNGALSEAFEDEVSAEFVASVADELTKRGLALTVLTPPKDEAFVPARDVAIDGALVYTCEPLSAGVEWLGRRRLPVVAVDQDLGDSVPGVRVDDRGGAAQGARHLLELGHRRIGILTIGLVGDDGALGASDSYPARERMAGWTATLSAAGVEPVVVLAPYQPTDAVLQSARELLDSGDVTGVLCFSDVFARAVVRAAEERGLSVPEDLSVVGYDDSPQASTGRPTLTTVSQDVTAKGHLAAGMLADVLEGRTTSSALLPASLVARESTGPVGAR
ncbi:MAG: LacI family DNA-binding transcriptional regulator [Propionibacteriales bacterium]|jgi:DNA-binding LacI/PurR family transcriptional regulator|nr:LacI family DNA-binding transcriptional regulator [Propionibacteriales bacterium]